MSNVQKISIALPKAMTRLMKRAVSGGQYASTSEVVREALRDWQEKQETPSLSLEDLRRLWQDGVDSGPGKLGSFDAILAEAKRRVASHKGRVP